MRLPEKPRRFRVRNSPIKHAWNGNPSPLGSCSAPRERRNPALILIYETATLSLRLLSSEQKTKKSCLLDHQTRVLSEPRRDTFPKPKTLLKIPSPISPSPPLSGNLLPPPPPPPRSTAPIDAKIPLLLLPAPTRLGFGSETMGIGFLEDRVGVAVW